jgi:hypothetical protein
VVEIISTILYPVSTSLSLSAWLNRADFHHFLHSYFDAQSTVITCVDMLILLGVISPLNRLDFLYIIISPQASAYFVDA